MSARYYPADDSRATAGLDTLLSSTRRLAARPLLHFRSFRAVVLVITATAVSFAVLTYGTGTGLHQTRRYASMKLPFVAYTLPEVNHTRRPPALATQLPYMEPRYSGHNWYAAPQAQDRISLHGDGGGGTGGGAQQLTTRGLHSVGISNPGDTRCHFRNVCLRLLKPPEPPFDWSNGTALSSAVDFAYHRPADTQFDLPGNWNHEFSPSGLWVFTDRDGGVRPRFEYEPIPATALWSPAEYTVLTETAWPENFGHAIGDDLFTVYRLAKSLNAWDRHDLGVIFHPDCSMRHQANGRIIGCRHHEELSEVLLDRPLESSHSPLWPTDGAPVCFQNLLMGTGHLGMMQPNEGLWPPFIGEIKHHVGYNPSYRPTQQKITILRKFGRRTLLNYEELQVHLEQKFRLPVEIINPGRLSIAEQISALQDTTVLVTPPGGLSFAAMFLSVGANAIFVDHWDASSNVSSSMDRDAFIQNDGLKSYFYPVQFSDLSCDRTQIPQYYLDTMDEPALIRNWCNTTVVLDRMERYVQEALLQAGVTFGIAGGGGGGGGGGAVRGW